MAESLFSQVIAPDTRAGIILNSLVDTTNAIYKAGCSRHHAGTKISQLSKTSAAPSVTFAGSKRSQRSPVGRTSCVGAQFRHGDPESKRVILIRIVRRRKQTRAYLTRPPRPSLFPSDHHHHLLSSDQKAINNHRHDCRRRRSTLNIVCHLVHAFYFSNTFFRLERFARKRFSPSAIFTTCGLFNSPCTER